MELEINDAQVAARGNGDGNNNNVLNVNPDDGVALNPDEEF